VNSMQVKSLFAPFLKWWWLIALSGVLAVGSCFLIIRDQPPVYNSMTTLLIGRTISNPNPSTNDIYLGQQLGNLYADFANTAPLKSETMKAMGMAWLPMYTIKPLANSQFLRVTVTDTDPARAARVATELANQLIKLSPGSSQSDPGGQQSFLGTQLALTQKNIIDTTNQITDKQNGLASLTSAHEIAQARQDIQTLQDKLTLMQSTYSNLLANSQTGASNTLTIIEPATIPAEPVGPGKPVVILIAGLVGLLLSTGTAYLLEFIDDTIKSPDEVTQLLNVPVIGYFARVKNKFKNTPFVALYPNSLMAEAYRTFRGNLKQLSKHSSLRTMIITSPDVGDGKTSVAVNLGVSLLSEGKRVILVDGDLRRPNVHNFLDMENLKGLGEVLNGEAEIWETLHSWKDSNLYILTAGHKVGLLDELLQADKLKKIINDLRSLADVIIFDTPPFVVSDALFLAPYVDGVVVVIKPEHTRRKVAKIMMERVATSGANIIGAVMNGIPLGLSGYASNYQPYIPYYYSRYASQAAQEKKNGHQKEKVSSLQNKN
jgi:polysaccharide biosynthesis transport protein